MLATHDLIVLLVIALFVVGAKMLPGLSSSIGKSMKAFKKGISGDAGAPPVCASCQAALQPDSSRCPRCGAVVHPLSERRGE
jgi:TatA/E family protein of Tat protein translocase